MAASAHIIMERVKSSFALIGLEKQLFGYPGIKHIYIFPKYHTDIFHEFSVREICAYVLKKAEKSNAKKKLKFFLKFSTDSYIDSSSFENDLLENKASHDEVIADFQNIFFIQIFTDSSSVHHQLRHQLRKITLDHLLDRFGSDYPSPRRKGLFRLYRRRREQSKWLSYVVYPPSRNVGRERVEQNAAWTNHVRDRTEKGAETERGGRVRFPETSILIKASAWRSVCFFLGRELW